MSLSTRFGWNLGVLASVGFAALLALPGGAGAQSLDAALAAAYINNPTLNSQRAGTRATDENVPQALSGYRPTVSAGASADRSIPAILPVGRAPTARSRRAPSISLSRRPSSTAF